MQEKEGYRYGWFTVPVVSLISGAREGGILVWLVHCARCVFDFRCKRRRDTGMAGSLCQLCLCLISGAREGGIPVWLVHCASCVFV